jgi:putative heme-binding domain-containing protein
MDWNEMGEAFFINTVIGHLWHLIPGAYYRRMSGSHPNPRIYDVIDQHADHVHWATGEIWTDVRRGVSGTTSNAGGGHAHSGLLIYQGGQWPEPWHGKLLTINFHGRRLNVDRLERAGSGYAGRHEPDAFFSADPWFRGIDLIAAPDGSVFVSDWSDTGECHDNTGVHRSSGRIYKILHGATPPRPPDLTRLSGRELAAFQTSPNDWLARSSRRVLADRAHAQRPEPAAAAELSRLLAPPFPTQIRLRALWALHMSSGVGRDVLEQMLSDDDEYIRAWALRLLSDHADHDAEAAAVLARLAADRLPRLAAREPSALVRLAHASLLRKLPPPKRALLAGALLQHAGDAADRNLPLVLWSAIEPLAAMRGPDFDDLISASRMPLLQRFGFRRLAEEIDSAPDRLDAPLRRLFDQESAELKLAALDGLADGLSGRRSVSKPDAWPELERSLAPPGASGAISDRIRDLSALFGDGRALASLGEMVLDREQVLVRRKGALRVLIDVRAPKLREICETVIAEPEMFATAASGLAVFDDPAIAERLLDAWPHLFSADRRVMIDVLVTRPGWAESLLEAVGQGLIERERLSGTHLRQIRGYKMASLDEQLVRIFQKDPNGRVPDADSTDLETWKRRLSPEFLSRADSAKGRSLFQATCGACHKMNGEGGSMGPDLTGSGRKDLDYLLENILTPNAQVADDYRLTTLTLADGRTLSGFVRARTGQFIEVQSTSELETVRTVDVVKEERHTISLMPEGLLSGFAENQVRDLIAYLMSD